MKRLYTLLFLLSAAPFAKAQLLGGEAFLQGNHVEVGVNACGSYGTFGSAPTGYHANGGGGGTQLGFVADPAKDGWATGSPALFGDYFLPGSPVAGWSLTVGTTTYSNDRGFSSSGFCAPGGTASTMTGSVTSVTSSGTSMQALWTGSGSGIQLKKYVTVKSTKAYFTTKVVLRNTTASPIYNVYYGEYVDPDNEVVQGGSYVTTNTVVSQVGVSGASASLVKAVGGTYSSYLGIGSKDCRSKVFRGTTSAGLTPNTLSAANWYNLTGSVDMSHSGTITQDNYVGIVFYADTILAGDSVAFTTAYILNEPDLTEALNETGPGFTAMGSSFNDGDTVLLCPAAGATYPISITNPDFYTWTWTPSTGLSTTTGPSVVATIGTSPITYYAIGNGPCGLDTVRITIWPQAPILHVDSSVAVSGSGASWASPLKTVREALNFANSVTCIQQIWVKKGTYLPTTGTNRDSSFRIVRNGLKMYGGFGGNDTTMATRNPALYPTILSGDIGVANDSTDNVYHVMTIVGRPAVPVDTSVRVDGFTITRGNSVGASGTITIAGQALPRLNGGGILLWGGGTGNTNHAVIHNCRFVRNAAGLGGGLNAEATSSGVSNPSISSCVFQQNRATQAGGGFSTFGATGASSPIVTNTSFTDNRAENFGGGAYTNGLPATSTATFTGCTFSNNATVVAASVGGGLYNAGPNLSLSGCFFLNNTAQNRGAGLTSANGSVTASRCVFAYNTAAGTGGSGGGFAQTAGASASATFTNCAFANNNAAGATAEGGGGIYLAAGSATLNNSTFSANTTASTTAAASSSASVRYATGTTLTLNNTIVWGGAAGHVQGTGTASYNYSLVKGLALAAPNLTVDPVFVNPADPDGADNLWATADDGIRLDTCSPAVNAGSNAMVPAGVTTDLPLGVRIQQVTVDMGAYESPFLPQPGAPVVNISVSATTLPCPDTIDFVATVTGGVPGTTYQWVVNSTPVGAPTTSSTFSPSTLANNDTVWVIVNNPPCNKRDSSNRIVVSIGAGPALSGSVTVIANPTACGASNGSITLGTLVAGTAYTISYTYNGTPQTPVSLTAGAGGTVTLSSLAAGIYSSIVVSVGTCSSAAIGPYTLSSPATPATPTATATTPICAGGTLSLSTPTVAGATYSWTGPGFSSSLQNPSIVSATTAASGSYSVTVTVAGCTSAPGAVTVVVNPNISTSVALSASPGTAVCAGTPVTFTATPTGGGTTPAYVWTVNGGTVPGVTGATYSSTTLANGDVVAVTLASSAPCATPATSSASVTMNVTPLPGVPGAITGPTAPCAGTTQTYSVAPVTGATSYGWTLPSGWTGTSTTSSITATVGTGAGTVSVSAANACDTSSPATLSVTPNNVPAAPASITGPATPCAGATETYSVTPVAGATTYTWTLPGGWSGTSTSSSISAIVGTTGGPVTVTADNVCGSSAATTLTTTVGTTPAAPGAISGPTTACAGIALTYSVTPVPGATSYNWTLPGGWTGSSATSSISATAGAAGGTVTVTAANGCGTSAASMLTVSSGGAPSAPGAISGPTGLCAGAGGTYTIAPVPGATTYIWTLPSGWTGSSSTNSIAATAATGSGTVQVVAQNGCGTSAPASLAVSAAPTTPVAVSLSSSAPGGTLCAGTVLTMTALASGGGPAPTYQWTHNGTLVAGSGPVYTPAAYATGDVIGVQLTSSAACPATPTATAAPMTLTVNPIVVPGINVNALISSAPVVCSGTPITFISNIVGGGTAPTYQWMKNGVPIPGATGTTYTGSGWVDGDTIKCILTSNAVCATPAAMPSNGVGLDVAPSLPPSATITSSADSVFTPGTPVTFTATSIINGGAAPALQWMRNGSPVYGATDSTWTTSTLMNGDTIRLRVTSSDICAIPGTTFSNSLGMRSGNTAGIGTQTAGTAATLELYPNPNAGSFTLTLPEARPGKLLTIQIFNPLGQAVYLREVFPSATPWTTEIKLGMSPAAGIYLLRVTAEDGGQTGVRFEVRY